MVEVEVGVEVVVGVCMITHLVLAACALGPYFPQSGPACVGNAQLEECRCSECFEWDAPAGHVTRYIVWRTEEPNGPELFVGEVDEQPDDRAAMLMMAAAGVYTNPPRHVWCVGEDAVVPREGVTYTYRVNACNEAGCAAGVRPVVWYTGAPYFDPTQRPPVQVNP